MIGGSSSLDKLLGVHWFEPSLLSVQQRLEAILPFQYAQTRNHLQGAVTGLSPYLTHGFISVPEVAKFLHQRHRLGLQHKLIIELGWREYFQHVRSHLGAAIFEDPPDAPTPPIALATTMPQDVIEATTDIPVIDMSVKMLYATGYLHNHARLWLASYLVHIRKIHWRAGADWLHALLLDGDLTSNHLSWHWVLGSVNRRPYLFNADLVAKFSPPAWHSPGSLLDKDMDTLEWMAGSKATFVTSGASHPPESLPRLLAGAPDDAGLNDLPDAQQLRGREVWLIHPWALGTPPNGMPDDAIPIAGIDLAHLQQWPWRHARWQFVLSRMKAMSSRVCQAWPEQWAQALAQAHKVHVVAHPDHTLWPGVNWQVHAAPRLWPLLQESHPSFSKWWQAVNRPGQSLALMLAQLN